MFAFLLGVSSVFALPQLSVETLSRANSSTYASGAVNYGFQINSTDDLCGVGCVSAVLLQLNYTGTATNYTATNASANGIYTYNVTGGLPAQFITYQWYSNNSTGGMSSGNANSTASAFYNVALGNVMVNVTGARNVTHYTQTTLSCFTNSTDRGTCSLFLNLTTTVPTNQTRLNNTATTLNGGWFNATANQTASQNFSAINAPNSSMIINFQITANSTVILDLYIQDNLFTNTTVSSNMNVNVTAISRDARGYGTGTLEMDGSAYSNNNTLVALATAPAVGGAGGHNFTYYSAANANFSANATGQTLYAFVSGSGGGSGGGGGSGTGILPDPSKCKCPAGYTSTDGVNCVASCVGGQACVQIVVPCEGQQTTPPFQFPNPFQPPEKGGVTPPRGPDFGIMVSNFVRSIQNAFSGGGGNPLANIGQQLSNFINSLLGMFRRQ